MKRWLQNIERIDVKPRPGGLDLRYSEWIEPLPPKLFKQFKDTLTWEDFALYPDTTQLKARIARHHGMTPVNIYLGAGSAECISDVFNCIEETVTVVTTQPCFPMYDVYAKQNNQYVTHVWPEKDNTYKAKFFTGGKLIVISRPSNPLGYFFTREDVIKILDQNLDRWVLVDEAYIEYVENRDDITDLVASYDNLIISRSFSKVFGAAGCRVGYLLSHSMNIDIISKMRPMYEISGPSMKYAMFMLEHDNEVSNYCSNTIKERKKLCKLFKSAKLKVLSSQGNWIHIEQTDGLVKYLTEKDIHVKYDITLPGTETTWVRITVGPGLHKILRDFIA